MRNFQFLLTITTVLLLRTIISSAEDFKPSYYPTINVPKISSEIKLDGHITEPFWSQAAVADQFAETDPGNQTKPSVDTQVLVAYDEANLYLAFICYDDPSTVRVSKSDRDRIFRDDYVGILFDTYGNQNWAYELFVNPYGIQGDLRVLGTGGEDISFDIIWDSRGIVTDSGYQVEVVIPFASLRFPDTEEQNWRVNFWRDHQRDVRRKYTWAAQDRDDPCWMCQYGYMKGIKGIKPGKNIEILPSVISKQFGYRDAYYNPDSDFINDDPEAELSFNAKYGLSTNSSIEIAVNPDFSQVESDATQIDVNNNFALFYPETRPFFQEGSQNFISPVNIVYTRTINDPQIATKFTGQFGEISIAYLFGVDENSPVIIPLMQQSIFTQAGKSYANILRGKYSLKNNSYIGFSVTDRRWNSYEANEIISYDSVTITNDTVEVEQTISHPIGSGYGSLLSFDAQLRFFKNYRLDLQVMFSKSRELNDYDNFLIDTTSNGRAQHDFGDAQYTVALDGEKYSGQAFNIQLNRNTQYWGQTFFYREFSPTFRADNGFRTVNDRRFIYYDTYFDFTPNKKLLVSWGPGMNIGRVFTYNGNFNPLKFNSSAYDEWLRGYVNFTFKGQTNLRLEYLNSRERYNGVLFQGISRLNFNINTRPSEIISGGVYGMFGKTINRNRIAPEMGNAFDYGVWVDVKPTERLFISNNFDFSRLRHRQDYIDRNPDEDEEIYSGYIFRSRVNYQFTRELFLRLVVQYNNFSEQFNIEPLLTYKINPFTKFYIGMANNYRNYYPDPDENILKSSQWDLSNRQFFAKFQYLFRM